MGREIDLIEWTEVYQQAAFILETDDDDLDHFLSLSSHFIFFFFHSLSLSITLLLSPIHKHYENSLFFCFHSCTCCEVHMMDNSIHKSINLNYSYIFPMPLNIT